MAEVGKQRYWEPDKDRPIKLLYTVEEAAQMLSLSRALLYKLVMRGQIASVKIEGARRVPLSSMQEFIKQQLLQS